MIQPWLFEFFSAFENCSPADDYAWYLDQWVRAEASGFEGIFFSEHHFYPGRYSPSPNLLIAAVAPLTRTLRLGVMGNVVPLYEPWRLAEEYGMLDQLSRGRLEIGYSTGVGPREFLAVGIGADDIRPRFAEALEVIDALLTQPRIDHDGPHWRFSRLGVSPPILQQPSPRRWLAGLSVTTAAMAAQRGYCLCTGFVSVATAAALNTQFHDAAGQAGRRTDAGHIGLRRMVFVSSDREEARTIGAAALARMRALMSGPPPGLGAGGTSAPPAHVKGAVPDAPQAARHGPTIADAEVIAGTPAEVTEQIIEQCRSCGAGHFLAYAGNALSRSQAERSLQLWREVVPLLRKAAMS